MKPDPEDAYCSGDLPRPDAVLQPVGAHALGLDVTLVTNNIREFKQIKNLKVVDWSV